MAIQLTAKIPFSRIEKIGIWSNEAEKAQLAAVYTKLQLKYPGKEVYISNAGFFSMCATIPAVFGLKADGTIYSNDWNYPYFGVKNNKELVFCKANTDPSPFSDAVSGYPALIENSKKSQDFRHCLDNSDRGRTCIGYTKDSIILACVSDCSGKTDWTLDEELQFMLKQGCTYAINLDGGGSTQCNFNGSRISSSRKVSNFIYIIATPEKSSQELENTDKIKRDFQEWLNERYKTNLSIDGSFGALTLKAMIKGVQTETGATADGSWGSKSKKAFSTLGNIGFNTSNVELTSSKNIAKIVQAALLRKGFWQYNISWSFEEELTTQLKAYQKKNRLTVTGLIDVATLTSLFK